MKKRFTVLICCFMLVICLTACQNKETSQYSHYDLPIYYFLAYGTILQTDDGVVLLIRDPNIYYWILDAPIIGEVYADEDGDPKNDYDISDDWDYRIIFCDTDKIKLEDGIYYIPHTATTHVVYVNEDENLIQFDNTVYSLYQPNLSEGSMTFCEVIRDIYDTALANQGDE